MTMTLTPGRTEMTPARRSCASPPLLLLLLLATLLWAGLRPAYAAPETTRLEARGANGYRGVLEFSAAPLVTMRAIPFRVTLRDPQGAAVTGARLTCDLTMPAMPMPENRPEIRPDDSGYRGRAIFTMAGAWQAEIAVTADGRPLDRLAFSIERVLLK